MGGATPRASALSGVDEARNYLEHPVLGPRLIECVEVLASLPGSDPVAVMGGTDAQKLRSSMTRFVHAAAETQRAAFKAVLEKYFKGAEDEATPQPDLTARGSGRAAPRRSR